MRSKSQTRDADKAKRSLAEMSVDGSAKGKVRPDLALGAWWARVLM